MRIVVKVGTSTLAYATTGRINIRRMEVLCKTISDIKNAGHEIIFVSSGAIAMGMGKLGLKEKPNTVQGKQACAAIGQCELMYTYDKLFGEYNHVTAQILVSNEDFANEKRNQNFINTIESILSYSAIPVINENDTVSTKEIEIGDNDSLGAYVAKSLKAELYVILSDINGLYTDDPNKNPDAKMIKVVERVDDSLMELAGDTNTMVGTGGMITKLQAAQVVTEAGCDMIIANGKDPSILYDVIDGKEVGTKFLRR